LSQPEIEHRTFQHTAQLQHQLKHGT